MKFIVLLTLLIISNIACSTDTSLQAEKINKSLKPTQNISSNTIESNANEAKDTKTDEDYKNRVVSIKNSIGLVVLSDNYPSSKNEIKDKDDFIRFYNEDGSLWYEFTYYYDDSDGKFEYENDEFRAFAFHRDDFLLALRCVGEDENRYKVVVNEDKEITKFVKKNDKTLKLESWENHILETFSIGLNKETNPVFESIGGKQMNLDFETVDRFEAVEIKGDWLKLKWKISNEEEKYKSGWVRWKEKDIILIHWFYFA